MSKSLGNIITIEKMRKTINGQVIGCFVEFHYKQPLDWNENLIKESQNTLDKWYTQFENTKENVLDQDLIKPLLEDINTPGYIAKLHYLYDKASKGDTSSKKLFLAGCKLIGLLEEDIEIWNKFKKTRSKIDEKTIQSKINDRESARNKGDYKLADIIRKELENSGVIIRTKITKQLGNINEKEKIYIFDTTLRDGAQTEGVNFSIDDKNKIAKALAELGVDYLEGGWPGAIHLIPLFLTNLQSWEKLFLQLLV